MRQRNTDSEKIRQIAGFLDLEAQAEISDSEKFSGMHRATDDLVTCLLPTRGRVIITFADFVFSFSDRIRRIHRSIPYTELHYGMTTHRVGSNEHHLGLCRLIRQSTEARKPSQAGVLFCPVVSCRDSFVFPITARQCSGRSLPASRDKCRPGHPGIGIDQGIA